MSKSSANSNAVVAVYDTHENADAAVHQLQKDGFDMTKLSVVGRDYHTEEHVAARRHHMTVGQMARVFIGRRVREADSCSVVRGGSTTFNSAQTPDGETG